MLQPYACWAVSALWARYAAQPLKKAAKPVDATLRKRQEIKSTLGGLQEIQLNNLQAHELRRLDAIDADELAEKFSASAFGA